MPSLGAIAAWWPALAFVPLGLIGWKVYSLFGWRGLAVFATAGVALLIYRKGAADSQAAMEQKAEAARLEAIRARNKVETDVAKMPDTAVDDALDQWLRDRPR